MLGKNRRASSPRFAGANPPAAAVSLQSPRGARAGQADVLLHPGRSEAARARRNPIPARLPAIMKSCARLLAHQASSLVDYHGRVDRRLGSAARFPAAAAAGRRPISPIPALQGHGARFLRRGRARVPALSRPPRESAQGDAAGFLAPSNPLDITAQAIFRSRSLRRTITPLLEDPSVREPVAGRYRYRQHRDCHGQGRRILKPVLGIDKAGEFWSSATRSNCRRGLVDEARAPASRSSGRPIARLRAMGHVTAYGRAARAGRSARPPAQRRRSPSAALWRNIAARPRLPRGTSRAQRACSRTISRRRRRRRKQSAIRSR